MKVYVDTNVFLDWCFNRADGIYSEQFFERAIGCEFEIVISDLLLFELKKYKSVLVLDKLREKLEFVKVLPSDKKKYMGIHVPDNVHISVALRSGCECIVTNDKDILLNSPLKAIQTRYL